MGTMGGTMGTVLVVWKITKGTADCVKNVTLSEANGSQMASNTDSSLRSNGTMGTVLAVDKCSESKGRPELELNILFN